MPDGRAAQGWLIAGTAGAEVRAISHGRVAFADWLKGYGLIVIVDHGDGWMSLYANNDALLKDAGDWVRAREPVATVGSSGAQGRPALYFELRRESRPVDPASWLQRR
ncbi:peptidoglycan DD-metalloendopeptidase family protein [Alkalisalibacterium limincola]|uniref:Peptidoglycan DD-metalloendopeptidase family protein n=2 Tax=Alkalisalibacterium limincola TaxID=2699169 RepID=A0A5C8KZ24_9GAMM|nr:peptidoglycan DD-metalloendopeptidase family protein [Alkalisalibacterium limincola]